MKYLALLLLLFITPTLGATTTEAPVELQSIEDLPLPLAPQAYDGVQGRVQELFAPDAIEKAKIKRKKALLKKKRQMRRRALAKKRKMRVIAGHLS